MNFEEHAAKALLRKVGIATPEGRLVTTLEDAERAAQEVGPCVVKAQVATGGRGRAGGIRRAARPEEAKSEAAAILGMNIGSYRVERLLIEQQVDIAHEMYAAVLNDPASKSPLLLFSPEGGMDIEQIVAKHPDSLVRLPVDIRHGLAREDVLAALPEKLPAVRSDIAALLVRLYEVYVTNDAELMEINPLVVTGKGELVALDCKFALDDGAIARQKDLAQAGAPDPLTDLEKRARDHQLKFIELDGAVGVLANGAGLTMTTMDAIAHYGGQPANFLEIGGDSYTRAKPALELVVANPDVKALLVNFCGAFARTDVMAEGVINAWLELQPDIPVFFTIHGTGEDEAIAMVREKLGVEPFDVMDDAVKAAVAAAANGERTS